MTHEAELTIYVIRTCEICRYAREIADDIRRRYPHVQVRVVDLATTTEAVPDAVFATPTYLLNGRVWSLGNPSPAMIEAAFAGVAA